MKLLREFFRLCVAGLRAVSVRRPPVSRGFSVTVPAPLARPAGDSAVVVDLQHAVSLRTATGRRESSFAAGNTAPRRLGAAR